MTKKGNTPKPKSKFILVPLYALQDMITNKNGIRDSYYFGKFFSLKTSPISDVEIIETEKRNYKLLTSYINTAIADNTIFQTHPLPEEALEDFVKEIIVKNEKYPLRPPIETDIIKNELDNYDEAYDSFYEMGIWFDIIRLLTADRINNRFALANKIYNRVEKHNPDSKDNIYCLVNETMMKNMVNMHDNLPSDTEREDYRAFIAMYLACASIVGSQPFKATTSELIKCRMFGARNLVELNQLLEASPERKAMYDKYTTRRRYSRLLQDLQIKRLVGECPWKRRTYISLRITDSVVLQQTVINKGVERQRQALREGKAAIREKAKSQTIV